jgi:hypothetical protein
MALANTPPTIDLFDGPLIDPYQSSWPGHRELCLRTDLLQVKNSLVGGQWESSA